MNHFKNYEKPDGWSPGQLEVLVSPAVVERLGMPVVDYGELGSRAICHAGADAGKLTAVLYGRSKYPYLRGLHAPFTNTVFVNAIAAENDHEWGGGTPRVLSHYMEHYGDGGSRKGLTAAVHASRVASFWAGVELAEHLPILRNAPFLGGLVGLGVWLSEERPERGPRFVEKVAAISPYQASILFPNTLRAAMMVGVGFVSDPAVVERLGGSETLSGLLAARNVTIETTRSDGDTKITMTDGKRSQLVWKLVTQSERLKRHGFES